MRTASFAILLVASAASADPPAPDFSARMTAAYALQAKGKWAEAEAELEAATKLRWDARAFAELGWSAMQAGHLDKARTADATALAIAGTDPALRATALFNLGTAEALAGEPGLARLSLQASLALRPNATVAAALAKLDPSAAPGACYEVIDQAVPRHRGAWVVDRGRLEPFGPRFEICDTPNRVVVADITSDYPIDDQTKGIAGHVAAVDRRSGRVETSSLLGTSRCVDRCLPVGHAGCSEGSGCTYRSAIEDAHTLEIRASHRWAGDAPGPATPSCGAEQFRGVVVCSTSHHVAIVDTDATPCSTGQFVLTLAVFDASVAHREAFDNAKPLFAATGVRDFTIADPTFRFGTATLALSADGKRGTLEIDHVTETCLALAIR